MPKKLYPLDDAEHATVMAALRYYQSHGQGEPSNRSGDIHNLATCGDTVVSLDDGAIDHLCENINFDSLHLRKEKIEFYYALVNDEGAIVAGVHLTHINFMRELEWLLGEEPGEEPAPKEEEEEEEDESRYTNSFLCPNDNTRWDDDWSCMCNDRCPTCNHEIEPFASTDNKTGEETIHNQEVYNEANGLTAVPEQPKTLTADRWDNLTSEQRVKIVDAAVTKTGKRVKAPTRYKMIHGKWDGLSKKAHAILKSVSWNS